MCVPAAPMPETTSRATPAHATRTTPEATTPTATTRLGDEALRYLIRHLVPGAGLLLGYMAWEAHALRHDDHMAFAFAIASPGLTLLGLAVWWQGRTYPLPQPDSSTLPEVPR